ncbi:hypothetical protein ACEN9D_28805 [Pseudomonas sp. CT11-2]|uniref:hypothetical protein n=1 Tax=unclassified Pseudomonas TaxID=196821 RepID=UPI00215F3A25|nr:hypothetical protein [Pseudomonas sp. B21-019]UVM35409.1 hypothetical protein LOY36_12155 [Pseudomonas sp. B21-019]
MSNHERFPQEWGEHLNADAPITAQQYVPPKTTNALRFEDMYPEPFEQMCWWLLQKDHSLTGCQRLGNKGSVSQHGIDLFAFELLNKDRLSVFECKCWRNFTGRDLTIAVDRFLAGEWAESAERFTLILAQSTIRSLDRAWIAAKRKLSTHGIEADLWTAEHLTEKLKNAPDVLTRFFSGPHVDQFCNQWMQKVGFHDALLKAIRDPRAEISAMAHEFLDSGAFEKEDLTIRSTIGRYWSLRKPLVDVSAMLPTPEDYPGSAIISITMLDTEGVMVVLDQPWLLNNLLGNDGEPLLTTCRPFFQGLTSQEPNNHIIDLKNCRFLLPETAAQEVVNAADEFSKHYIQSLNHVETQWEARNFPFVKWLGTRVALCKVDAWVWELMLEFANAHDTNNGSSQWHMFHNASNRLMPVSSTGYHGVIFGAVIEDLCSTDQIAILWEPPTNYRAYSETRWSCMETYRWLINELLPAVGHWRAGRMGGYWRNWLHPFATRAEMTRVTQFWNSADAYTDVRSMPLVEAERFRKLGVVETLETLQQFYNSDRSERAWFTACQRAGLYQTLLLLLKGGKGFTGYIRSNLGISSAETHEDLCEAISDILKQAHFIPLSDNTDYVMRAMLEATGRNGDWISANEREQIFQALLPYMQMYDRQLLIERHSRYL